MAAQPIRTTIFMCTLAGLVGITMILTNQSDMSRRSSRHNSAEFQDDFIPTHVDLQVPAQLQTHVQRGDLNSRLSVEELRMLEPLRISVQQGEIAAPKSTVPSSESSQPRLAGESSDELTTQPNAATSALKP